MSQRFMSGSGSFVPSRQCVVDHSLPVPELEPIASCRNRGKGEQNPPTCAWEDVIPVTVALLAANTGNPAEPSHFSQWMRGICILIFSEGDKSSRQLEALPFVPSFPT
jgi:hypothetical protein